MAVEKHKTKNKKPARKHSRGILRKKTSRLSSPRRRASAFGEGITKIKIVGVGGAGGNIVTRMKERLRIKGVEYIAVNTDAQDLNHTLAHRRVYIGKALTKGLGAGMNPEIGKQAAEENRSEIGEVLEGTDIVFITAGLGGGTGSGAAPVIAEIARDKGILTVGIVTKPFSFEGNKRMSIAQEAIGKLKDNVDALVVIPNDRIFSIINKDTSVIKAFSYIDDVLKDGVRAIADLINSPGIINVDFADVKTILKDAGPSLIGVGIASGQERSVKAVDAAVNSPLLEASIEGARGVLFSIAGGRDLKMAEINDVAKTIVANLDQNARVIFGAYCDGSLKDKSIKVTVIATGFNGLFSSNGVSVIPSLFVQERKPLSSEVKNDFSDEENNVEENTPQEGGKASKKDNKPKSEPWDIPAFLRKRKR